MGDILPNAALGDTGRDLNGLCLADFFTVGPVAVFRDEMQQIYERKDAAYSDLVEAAQNAMREMISRMQHQICDSPIIEDNMRQLVQALETTTGKKQYGYLKKPLKQLVDTVVDALAELPEVSECYEVWNQIHEELNECYGHSTPWERLPLSQRKEFRKIKNDIIREAESIRLGLPTFEDEGMQDDPELETQKEEHRNYGTIAKNCYGYNVSVIDLRNPTRSDGNNLLTLVNRYMDIARKDPKNLAARAKAEKYAKILAKTIVNPDGDDSNRGQNAFFYDAAEGLLTSVILMLAEFLPPDKEHPQERRHIVSVFKLVQDLLEPSKVKGKSHFQLLMGKLPPDHKARWFAGAALNSAEQAMASVMSTVLSRLNAFLDSELEQVLCFDSAIDAEKFASEKSAIFLILPEEDTTKNFMAGLMIQNLSRELFAVADENGGKLQNRVVLYCDEFGTMPPFDVLPLFSAGRSRRLTLVPIIQSLAQLEKNYGKEGSEIIQDNCQDTIFGGFAPNSQTAEVLSKALGNRTVLSGSVSRGKNDPSQSLQMMERPLLMPDELKSIPKGNFIVQKTGQHPMRTRLRLFLEWGITFKEPYIVPERADRAVAYANREDLEHNLPKSNKAEDVDVSGAYAVSGRGGMAHEPAVDKPRRRGGKQMKTYGEEDL